MEHHRRQGDVLRGAGARVRICLLSSPEEAKAVTEMNGRMLHIAKPLYVMPLAPEEGPKGPPCQPVHHQRTWPV